LELSPIARLIWGHSPHLASSWLETLADTEKHPNSEHF
jgi:hypothetical protein